MIEEVNKKYFPGFRHIEVETAPDVIIHAWVGPEGGEPLLMLHGHPESHLTWFNTAPELVNDFTVVVMDMRGYGESSKPHGLPDHSTYSKSVMAEDGVKVMQSLGYEKFHLVGHDRGARVCHRMIVEHPEKIMTCMLLDIIPTVDTYEKMDMFSSEKFWHWFFYIQQEPFPETFLGSEPEYFIRSNIQKKTIPGTTSAKQFPEDIILEYIRYYSDRATVHAIAEDYRASRFYDWDKDIQNRGNKIKLPMTVLWGSDGMGGRFFNMLDVWKLYAEDVEGFAVPSCGHFVAQEKSEVVIEELKKLKNRKHS